MFGKKNYTNFIKTKLPFMRAFIQIIRARPSLRQIELSSQWETGTRK
jgi:hypothetical protein